MNKKNIILWLAVMAICLQPLTALAQSGRQTGIQIDPPEEEDVAWQEDIDKKIDATIAVLKIIQDEVKDMPQPTPGAKVSTAAGTQAQVEEIDWSERFREAVKRMSRVWRKFKKMQAEYADHPEDTSDWAEDMDKKLDKTMQAMQAMRDELQKIQEEDADNKK